MNLYTHHTLKWSNWLWLLCVTSHNQQICLNIGRCIDYHLFVFTDMVAMIKLKPKQLTFLIHQPYKQHPGQITHWTPHNQHSDICRGELEHMFGGVLDRAPGVPHKSLHKTQQWKHGENKPSSPVHPAQHGLCVYRRLGWNQQRLPFSFGAFHGTHWTDVVSRFKMTLCYPATSITCHINN